jgi:hypothetical protein
MFLLITREELEQHIILIRYTNYQYHQGWYFIDEIDFHGTLHGPFETKEETINLFLEYTYGVTFCHGIIF